MDSYSYFFIRLFSVFFFFYVKMQKKIRSNCSIIGCDLSKKHKLTLYKTQNGEPNYVDHKFFFNFYQQQNLEIQILQSSLVGWCMYCMILRIYDIKKLTSVSLEYITEVHLAAAYISPFWQKSSLHLSIILWVAIYIYFCYTFY